MALTDENSMVMPVAPAYGNSGMGFGGDWSSWIILFLIFGMFGGWGNGGFGGGFGGDGLYPWMNNSNQINNGFRDQMINSNIQGIQNGITSGFGDVQNSLCSGFAGVNAAIAGAQNGITAQMYGNQIADLERSFAAQTAQTQGMTALQSQLAQCCCDNRLATANLQSVIQSENCSDRQAISDGIRDLLTATTQQNQRVLDQLCQDKIDAKNEKIAELQNQLTMAQLAANNNAQTAAILANNEAQTAALEQYLAPVPRPAYVVQNPNCCGTYSGCGCA